MRIGVTGTHFMGKTTFIQDFINAHPDYTSHEEAYYQLMNEKDVELALEPSLESLIEELDYCLELFARHADDDKVIYDRTPLDYVAYAMCCVAQDEYDLTDNEISERFPDIIEFMQALDILLFIPLDSAIEYTEENPAYRIAADENFKRIIRDGEFDLLPEYRQPRVIEVVGNREARIRLIESYLCE